MESFSVPELSDLAVMNDGTDSPAVSVIVPLFNEEENVPILQSELTAALAGLDYEIIFVDDGSSDRTVERVALGPGIRVLRFEKNAGQSAALYAGLGSARGGTAVLIDGDLQNDPADISRLLAEVERGADLVCGYRPQRKDTFVKRATSRVANFVSLQGDASVYSSAGERRGVSARRDSRESSAAAIWPEQIRSG